MHRVSMNGAWQRSIPSPLAAGRGRRWQLVGSLAGHLVDQRPAGHGREALELRRQPVEERRRPLEQALVEVGELQHQRPALGAERGHRVVVSHGMAQLAIRFGGNRYDDVDRVRIR